MISKTVLMINGNGGMHHAKVENILSVFTWNKMVFLDLQILMITWK